MGYIATLLNIRAVESFVSVQRDEIYQKSCSTQTNSRKAPQDLLEWPQLKLEETLLSKSKCKSCEKYGAGDKQLERLLVHH